jgi:hypothetical protein
MDHNSQQPSHMPLRGPALSCPLMPLMNQYFHTHYKSYNLLTNNKNLINKKESIHGHNISTNATNNQNNPHKQENKANTPKS